MPFGLAKPAVTVVTGYGVVACGVMIDTEAPKSWVVQRLVPSKAMALGPLPRLLAAVATAPGGWAGSITYSLPGETPPATKTLPAATITPRASVAPVQVPSTLPVPACTWITWLPPKADAQMALPSAAQNCGPLP